MLHRTLLECNGPVRRVAANWCRNREAFWQLGVNLNISSSIQFFKKIPLYLRISENIIVDVVVGLDSFAQILLRLLREDVNTVGLIRGAIGQVLHNYSRLLLVHKTGSNA